MSDDAALKSSFYERMTEHAFLSELLQEAHYRFGAQVAILRPEVDNEGYDLVLECRGVIRHVQLKTSRNDSKTGEYNIKRALADKPSGCSILLLRQEDTQTCRMTLTYRFFGSGAGERLPSLADFRTGKNSRGDSQGVKKERPAICVVPKGKFQPVEDVAALYRVLFLRE